MNTAEFIQRKSLSSKDLLAPITLKLIIIQTFLLVSKWKLFFFFRNFTRMIHKLFTRPGME